MPDEVVPDIGSLVQVRGQRWVVGDLSQSGKDTLVELHSIKEDQYGHKLRVIWEVEAGRRILPRSSLPAVVADGFDAPEKLAAFLDAQRWSAVTSADARVLQAPFRSGVDIELYQLEPVGRALASPRVNQLLADDVGLGKTIEAGLVALELLLRHRAQRVMIVCPAGLVVKWRDEMLEKFGLDFQIVNTQACADLRRSRGSAANPFDVYPRTIVSLPWLRGPKAGRLLDEVLPSGAPGTRRYFDLLILDEAHHVAPAAPKQRYAVDSKQTKLIRRLTPHFEHRLFLSATPHNGYPESFTALLELIDPQRFARGVAPDSRALDDVIVRRLKQDIVNADGAPRFAQRENEQFELLYDEKERQVHRWLSEFTNMRRSRRTKGKRGRQAADLVTLLLKKRLISSPAAFTRTVGVYLNSIPTTPADASDEVPELFTGFRERTAAVDDEELVEVEDHTLKRSAALQEHSSVEEVDLLRRIASWSQNHEARPDAKATQLLDFLTAVCRPDRDWTNERVVVFTEYRDTLLWLKDLLYQRGLGGERLSLLHGGVSPEEREQLRLAFQSSPADHPVRILLATDAAGEGIDLQAHCHRLVNYDIPFNPNKLEQRIGRIDRYGQHSTPRIWHFAPSPEQTDDEFYGELEYLSRVAVKVARMEEDLGSVNAVLADGIHKRLLGDHTAVVPESTSRGARKQSGLKPNADVSEQVKRLTRVMDTTVDKLHLRPEAVKRVVDTALELAHQQPLTSVEVNPISERPAYAGEEYSVQTMTGEWVRVTDGLAEKLRREDELPRQRPITFDPDIARGRDDVVLAHLGHPLVAMSAELLRAAVSNESLGLNRVTALISDDPALEDTLVGCYARFVLVGADGVRLHEEIFSAGGWVPDTGRFRRLEALGQLDSLLATALAEGRPVEGARLRQRLADAWPRVVSGVESAVRWRRDQRESSLAGLLAKRVADEQRRVADNLDTFAASLREALREEPEQDGMLSEEFWTDPEELRQRRRDREVWKVRYDQLMAERDRELAAVAHRYAEPKTHVFPVATIFVVPSRKSTR